MDQVTNTEPFAGAAIATQPHIVEVTAAHGARSQQLLEQAQRGEIVDADTAAGMTDIAKIAATEIKRSEDARKALVTPINDHIKWINNQFKAAQEPARQAKEIATNKLTMWQRQEAERQRREAEERQRLHDKVYEDAAAKAEETGDRETADKILDAAAAAPSASAPKQTATRGSFGGVASLRGRWRGEVVDRHSFFMALATGALDPDKFVDIKQSALNDLAMEQKAQHGDKASNTVVHGIRVFKDERAQVR